MVSKRYWVQQVGSNRSTAAAVGCGMAAYARTRKIQSDSSLDSKLLQRKLLAIAAIIQSMLSSRSHRLTRSLHQRKIWALTYSTHLHTDEKVTPRHCKRPRRNHNKHCSASKSRICFSTVSEDQNEGIKVSSSETAPIDHLKKVTERLVESEIGSLSQASILEITTSISSWHTQAITNPLDEKNFDRSETLLSRF